MGVLQQWILEQLQDDEALQSTMITRLESMLTNLEAQVATIDLITGAVKSVNSDHNYIHKGGGFKAYIEIAEVGATPIVYSFKTPTNLYPHFKNLKLDSRVGSLRVSIRRATAVNPLEIDDPGTATPAEVTGPFNLNDLWEAERPSGVTILKTPSFVSGREGMLWAMVKNTGSSTNQYKSSDQSMTNDNEELVMDKDTYYTIKFERIGTDSPQFVTLEMFWYEEPMGKKE